VGEEKYMTYASCLFFLKTDVLTDESESVDEEGNKDDVSEEDVPSVPRWRTHSANITDYPECQASLPKSENIMSPNEYFKMFFSEDILEEIAQQSNLYAIQCDTYKPLNLTTKELEQFMGTAVHMDYQAPACFGTKPPEWPR